MPTSSDATSAPPGRNIPMRRRASGKTASTDPTDPRNNHRPLNHLAPVVSQPIEDLDNDFDRWDKDYELNAAASKERFWDAQAIMAAGISFTFGTVIGVPLGHYLYGIWI